MTHSTEKPPAAFDIRIDSGSRSPCVHLSDILSLMDPDSLPNTGNRIPQLCHEFAGNEGASPDLCKIAMGLAWEEWYGRQIERSTPTFRYHPGEIEQDGIICTPDGIELKPVHETAANLVLHEIKVTFGPNLAMRQRWLQQTAAYCHVLGCTTAYLHVYWVIVPMATVTILEFSQEELRDLWDEILMHKKRL
jgi:hypothetical protein